MRYDASLTADDARRPRHPRCASPTLPTLEFHTTLVSAPSDDDAPARRAKKRAAAATPKKAKKARKICVEC